MRTSFSSSPSQLLLGTNHLQERDYHRKVDDALFDAIIHRLATARSQLLKAGSSNSNGQTGATLLRRIDSLARRLGTARRSTENYHAAGPFNGEEARSIHTLILGLADCAENMFRRFERPSDTLWALSAVESDLNTFEKLLDGFAVASTENH